MFERDKHDALPQTVHDSRWSEELMGWLASLTLEDDGRRDLSLPRVVCEYEDVFLDEHNILSADRWSVGGDHTNFKRHAGRMHPGY